ncbi:uncharacterized protein LOC134179696 [Corticium candelabrum]|uniref:uncharacterized protein LOC134179696 n=1 Tax=Corticium candelabrum TaxID=121492 RepID=UPI002E2691F4|nr:uncharacterized protein LOC134179696 [Corticium candelabrum]
MTREGRTRDEEFSDELILSSEESHRDSSRSPVIASDRWRGRVSCLFEKGNLSVLVSFAVGITGILVRLLGLSSCNEKDEVTNTTSADCNEALLVSARYFIASGLFGFAGGITNWVALKMLFHRIPLVYAL